MKKLHLHIASMLLLAVSLLAASCGKDGGVGPAGPAGPAGTNGTNGTNGTAGSKGDKGDTGTANVIYSDWLDVGYLPDTLHAAGGVIDTIGYYAGVDAPKLTLALLSTSDVKVYINLNTAADPVIAPLPYVDETGVLIRFVAYEQVIQFYSNIDASTFQNNAGVHYSQYRYIIIPGGVAARKKAGANIDWNDYKQVKAYLGLKN